MTYWSSMRRSSSPGSLRTHPSNSHRLTIVEVFLWRTLQTS